MPAFAPSPPTVNPEAGAPYRDVWPGRLLAAVVEECAAAFLVVCWLLPLGLGLIPASHLATWLASAPSRGLVALHLHASHRLLIRLALGGWLSARLRHELVLGHHRLRGLVVRSHLPGSHGDVLPGTPWHHRDEHWCWRKGVRPPVAPRRRRLRAPASAG